MSKASGFQLVRPFWIPDEDAYNCGICDAPFTSLNRRVRIFIPSKTQNRNKITLLIK